MPIRPAFGRFLIASCILLLAQSGKAQESNQVVFRVPVDGASETAAQIAAYLSATSGQTVTLTEIPEGEDQSAPTEQVTASPLNDGQSQNTPESPVAANSASKVARSPRILKKGTSEFFINFEGSQIGFARAGFGMGFVDSMIRFSGEIGLLGGGYTLTVAPFTRVGNNWIARPIAAFKSYSYINVRGTREDGDWSHDRMRGLMYGFETRNLTKPTSDDSASVSLFALYGRVDQRRFVQGPAPDRYSYNSITTRQKSARVVVGVTISWGRDWFR